MLTNEEEANFRIFLDCLSTPLIESCTSVSTANTSKRKTRGKSKAGRKGAIKPISKDVDTDEARINDAAELADFIEYIALEIFTHLPCELRTLSHKTYTTNPTLQKIYPNLNPLDLETSNKITQALPPSIPDSLHTYSLLPPCSPISEFLHPVLNIYTTQLLTPSPPAPPHTLKHSTNACELCNRDWIPLTYHHLIPKFVHTKVLKRGWHTQEELNNVAWLCRACHSFVHRVAGHEELAREFYTVELLGEREDVARFVEWVGRVRWKSR
ncbi:66129792-84d8-4b93-851e-aa57c8a5649d [Sclerotinia trifoliorum]|uniref:66129792-84d8-4b93-851e-aa57c8a5649d n=1 Tax=Sclerotinia trifoliorum TaxID=28548 RepID=A0A8H2ZYB3_9HELO|nr:66129792-84d8-4b93-851e-aa57c8a5649d [Sclerotinia trifoliorum]